MSALERIHSKVDPSARAAAASALSALNQALLYIEDARRRAVEAGDTDGLMLGLEQLTKFQSQLATVIGGVKASLTDMVPPGWHPVPHGDGWVSNGKTHKDTWDSPALVRTIAAEAVADYLEFHEGEVESVMSLADAVRDALLACAPLTASTAWRVTALREREIDPDDFRERTERESLTWAAEPPPNMRAKLARITERAD